MIVLSLAILATLTVIGVTLVAAMLVIPAVIARMLTDSFGRMLTLSTVIGTACGLIGMYLSYYAGVPSGTMIVLVGAAVFIVVLAITGGRGLRRSAGLDSHSEDLLAEPGGVVLGTMSDASPTPDSARGPRPSIVDLQAEVAAAREELVASIADLKAQATPEALAGRGGRSITGCFTDEFGGVRPERVAIVGAVVVGLIVLRLIARRRK